MKIALVHDYLTQFGGGERVLSVLCEMFPEAPVFTLIYNEKATNGAFKNRKIRTSFLQKIPGAKKFFRGLIWLMPLAVEQFDFSDFDLVISVSHSFGKGIITKPTTKHICYCLTPTRYLWHDAGLPFKPFSRFLLTYLRTWDFQAAQRPDYFIACSETVRQRIKKYYRRDSEVIYPPVEVLRESNSVRSFSAAPAASSEVGVSFFRLWRNQAKTDSKSARRTFPHDYFLIVGRLVPYKRFDIAVDAFAKMSDEKLLIIGNGPEYKRLKAKSNKLKVNNIEFLGQVSDSELAEYYSGCKALIFPQEEDFGITPVEVMAYGKPVIAYRAGGATETIKEGESGLFFNEQNSESLIKAIKSFDKKNFNSEKIRNYSVQFDKSVFNAKISEWIKQVLT